MSAQKESPIRLYLVDGSSYIFRAYHALPPLTRSDGTPVGAVAGYCNMLYKLLADMNDEHEPTHFAVIFDHAAKTFRNDIYPEYKANRPEPPKDLVPQFELVREATRAFNVPCIELEGYEADDIIASYAKQATDEGGEVVIISSDKDLMQLVSDKVSLFDTMKNRKIGPDEVAEKFGAPPEKVVEVQALAGDPTDNIPGVPGIGVKTAAQLIEEYGDLETLLAHAGEIKQPKRREKLIENADQARISKQLVSLKTDAPLPEPLQRLVMPVIDREKLASFLKEMEFKTLLRRVESDFGSHGAAVAEGSKAAPDRDSYETVFSREALEKWVERARERGFVAVDTETDSLDPMRANLVGVSLATAAGTACYIPLAHGAKGLDLDDADASKQLPPETAIEILKPLLEDESVLKIGQNIKYDAHILRRRGVNITPFDDTMLISYALDCGRGGHGMDELARRWLDHETIKFLSLIHI